MQNQISKKAQAIKQKINKMQGIKARPYATDKTTVDLIDQYIKERMKDERMKR